MRYLREYYGLMKAELKQESAMTETDGRYAFCCVRGCLDKYYFLYTNPRR